MSIESPKQPANQNEQKIELPEKLSLAMAGYDFYRFEDDEAKMNQLVESAEEFFSEAKTAEDLEKRFEAIRNTAWQQGYSDDIHSGLMEKILLGTLKRKIFPPKKKK
jgi:hypothetical protein